jgi:uncharacterized flavoprotein (TIGR03862 family)
MAAETLAQAGLAVDLYDAMPSLARKFLLAGKGGLNLTHSEPSAAFLARYGERSAQLSAFIAAFGPQALRAWAHELGIETFVGTSGRVFPAQMKAAPLLRAWLHRLRGAGVRIHVRHRWRGWDAQQRLEFITPEGIVKAEARATVLALGGASWHKLGSDGAWVSLLEGRGVGIAPLQPSNCGFNVHWSAHFRDRFAGHPVKSVAVATDSSPGWTLGEFVVSEYGVEGSLIYAHSARLREQLAARGEARMQIDLAPARTRESVAAALRKPRRGRTLANVLRTLGIDGVKAGLLRERVDPSALVHADALAASIKGLPIRLSSARPLDEAISSAGGVLFAALDADLMLKVCPGVFCAGEMLDWDAPTGGYLLTACFATGRAAGAGAAAWVSRNHRLTALASEA